MNVFERILWICRGSNDSEFPAFGERALEVVS